jgi:hypothetical protein
MFTLHMFTLHFEQVVRVQHRLGTYKRHTRHRPDACRSVGICLQCPFSPIAASSQLYGKLLPRHRARPSTSYTHLRSSTPPPSRRNANARNPQTRFSYTTNVVHVPGKIRRAFVPSPL